MKTHKNLLLLLVGVLYSGMLFGQSPTHKNYILRESKTQKFYDNYTKWTVGNPLFSDEAAEDEEFFISRVRPRTRFTNVNTQVNTSLDGQRKLIWWCPIGTSEWNALPAYFYNSEVFSMWSYLDHYGNWTAPFVRSPGAFTDACHKNGVVNSVVASVPFGAKISVNGDDFGKTFNALSKGGADKLLKFLKYYGIDGLGFNSEFNFEGATFRNDLNQLFVDAFKKKDAAGLPNFAMAWYSLTGNNGTIRDGSWDSLNEGNKNWFDNNGTTSNYFFLNYNWGNSHLNGSQNLATSLGRSSYDVYAGMNFQGRGQASWLELKNYDISIGIWGAHNMNMIYESRGELGAAPEVQQRTYQTKSEVVFTGGSQNPVNTPPVTNLLTYGAKATNFHGMSKFLNARSTLHTDDLAKDPFVTYFNLGNGTFFNVKGETTFPNEWYNLGMQDYLPTWRWWIHKIFMGREAYNVPTNGIKAEFTWEDAWFGGSCLKVSGESVDANYLHLFKTQYPLKEGDKVTVRYKILHGTGDIKLSASAEGTESQEVTARIRRRSETENNLWQEKVIKVGARAGELNLANKTLAILGLRFQNTSDNFTMLIGEMSIKRGTTPTPKKPEITLSKLLSTSFKGVDYKVVFKMAERIDDNEEPIYNDEVNTWYYKIYAQQKNEHPILCTATTSWAAYVVHAPYNSDGENQMRFGVSAVSLDGDTESEIAWTDYNTIDNVELLEGIEIDKPVIKVNEEFTVKYIDPAHAAAKKWEILNGTTGASVKVITNTTKITTSLPQIGIYDLALTYDVTSSNGETTEKTFTYRGLIQISGAEVGALPHINFLKANNSTSEIEAPAPVQVKYTYEGRPADGAVSRALRLPEKPFSIKGSQLNLTDQSPYSICFWFKADKFRHLSDGTQILNIRTNEDSWPANNWGYVWSSIGQDGIYALSIRKTSNAGTEFKAPNFVFLENQWTHIAFVVDWVSGGRKVSLYANGKLIGESEVISDLYPWKQSNYIMVGGSAFNRSGLDGAIDEFQFYKKALNADEVLNSMKHQTTIPEGLVGYWDFETDPNPDTYLMMSKGTDKNISAMVASLERAEGEGAFSSKAFPASFTAGAPFIEGSKYLINTTAKWQLDGATIVTQPTGDATNGETTVKYLNNGIYSATVTLNNAWGMDSKTFQFVKVGGSHNVTYEIIPNGIHSNNVSVSFANPGSEKFSPVVSGQAYPDGVTLRLKAMPISLDGKKMFTKWTINGENNNNSTVDIVLNEDKILTVTYIDYTGVETVKDTYEFKVGPNPFVDRINLQFVKNGNFTIDVVTLNGQLVSSRNINAQNGQFTTLTIDGDKGLYFVNIKENGKLLKSLKLLKK